MIESIFLVDDEDLFHLVFEDACSLLNISLSIDAVYSTDEAEVMFAQWQNNPSAKPKCAFIDLNVTGSSFDGIELIYKVNRQYGNGIIIGIISSSIDTSEIERAKSAGAMFWIVKSDEVEPRLEQFHKDYQDYVDRIKPFTIYR
tara:strand:+ start:5052 stop:5483 length:432 start_codon:yes stop_codon:yes gene_type:complete